MTGGAAWGIGLKEKGDPCAELATNPAAVAERTTQGKKLCRNGTPVCSKQEVRPDSPRQRLSRNFHVALCTYKAASLTGMEE